MAEQIYNAKCGFFDAVNNDRVYTAEDMNRLYKRIIHDGVFPDENNNPSDDFLVGADSGMTIIVGTGEGVFASHWLKNSVEIPIDVPSNSSNDRIDSVVIQVDTRKSGRAGNIVYRTGEPSINPAPPQINEVLGVVEYRLANISVTSGATAITSADITDLRGTSECPWVTGIVSANDIPPNSVTEAKLAANAVTTAKIKNGAVTGAKIADGAVTSAKIGNGEVKTVNLADEAVTKKKLSLTLQSFVDNGYVQKIATVSTLSELESKLYHINPCIYFLTLTGACATAFNVQSGAKARLIMFGDWNSSITRWLKIIDNGAEWTQTLTISGDTYTFGTWTRLSKELLYGELPSELVDEINTKIAYDSAVITNGSQLDTANYAVPEIELGVKLTSQAAAGFQVESGTIGLLKTVEADGVIKRYMTFPEIEGVKWVQTVNSIAPSWSAGIWTKVDFSVEADTKIDKPTKCIYFGEDDCVYTLTSGIHTGGARVGITSVYAPSSVTEIPDRALVSTPDLATIYIDNASSAVTLGTDIQAAVNNEKLIIYYKGQFNLANILATSQKKLNLRLISLEATVGTVNTILENAINGVS